MNSWTGMGKFESMGRLCIPQSLTALLFVLDLVHIPIPVVGVLKPFFILMAVYYWSAYRPTLLPPLAVFGMGIGLDLLAGLPVGLSALVLLCAQWVVRSQRRFLMGQSFGTLWLGFAIVSVGVHATRWAIFGLIHLNWPNPAQIAMEALLGIGLFPLIAAVLFLTHTLLPAPPLRS